MYPPIWFVGLEIVSASMVDKFDDSWKVKLKSWYLLLKSCKFMMYEATIIMFISVDDSQPIHRCIYRER